MIVDLSHRLDDGIQVYPGDPQVSLRPAATLEVDGFNVLHVSMGSHSGTHVDAPHHCLAGGARVDEVDLSLFVGPAVIADVRSKGAREVITWADLEPVAHQMAPGSMLVVHTGWSRHFGSPTYLDHPHLDAAAAERVLATGVRTLAVDTLDPDRTVVDGGVADLPVHELVLGAGGVVAENLTNLSAVTFADPLLVLLPLPLAGGDGSPVRAVAMQLG